MLHLISWQEERVQMPPSPARGTPRGTETHLPSLASEGLPEARRQVNSGLLTQNMAQAETEVPGSEAV